MDFLTTGQKIRKIRKILKMNQEDLSTDGITRPFISMIESEKRGLSYKKAKLLAESFNKKAKQANIELFIDADYILRTPSEDAEKYCLEKLINAKSIADFEKIIQISNKFSIENISAKAYHKIGDLYFKDNCYMNAFAKYNTALDLYKNISETKSYANIYNSIGKCKMKLLQYSDALFYFQQANLYALKYSDNDIQRISTYNLGLSFKKLNEMDNALHYLNEFLAMCNKDNNFIEYIYANILICTCYEIQDNIDKSLETYNNLIPLFYNQQGSLLAMVYSNLGSAYLKKNDYVKSLDYFNLSQKIRADKDPTNLHHTIIEKSEVFIKQKFYDEAIILIKLGLELASKFNDSEYLLKGNYFLAQIYTSLNEYFDLEKVYVTILDILKDINDNEQILKLYNDMATMYLKQNKLEKVEDCLQMSQKIFEKSYKFRL